MTWGQYAALGREAGVRDAVQITNGEHNGKTGSLCEAVPIIDEDEEYDVLLAPEPTNVTAEAAADDQQQGHSSLSAVSPDAAGDADAVGQVVRIKGCDLKMDGKLMRATVFAKALGEVLIFEKDPVLARMPILSPSWLAETMKCVVCHNHEQSLQFDRTIFDSLDARSFGQAKRDLLDRGILSKQLLRRLWARIGLDEQSYSIMRKLLSKFEVAIELVGTGSLLVPTFLPQHLPIGLWPPERGARAMELQWWYAIRSFQPPGLMERVIVLLQDAGYEQFRCAKEGIVLHGSGNCQVLCELAEHSEFNERGVRVSVRGPQTKQGTMGAKGWQHARAVLATLDQLLKQWPGMMVFKYIVVQRPSGDPAYVPLLQAQSARDNNESTVPLPNDGSAMEQEEVAVEALLGPVDVEAGGGDEAGGGEEEPEEAEEEAPEKAIPSHGKAAGSTEEGEEEEFEDYRVIVESMHKSRQQWVMLSYCWGRPDETTGRYDMQQTVIKVFRRLVREHGLPCWLDIFGGMGGDVYESMAKGVRGAAVVVPFLSSAYDVSANGKRELKFACNLN
jgi:hypothetical protein